MKSCIAVPRCSGTVTQTGDDFLLGGSRRKQPMDGLLSKKESGAARPFPAAQMPWWGERQSAGGTTVLESR